MVVAVRVKVSIGKATRKLASIRRNLPIKMQQALNKHGKYVVAKIREDRFRSYPGFKAEDKSRDHLYNRTRKLRASIRSSKIAASGNKGVKIQAGVGLSDNRAVLQEFGGVVRGTPFIEIPLEGVLTSTGRVNARFMNVGASLAKKGVFIRPLKKGPGFIILQRRADGTVVPLWVMKEQITIPGPRVGTQSRFRFRETIQNDRIIREHLKNELRVAAKKSKTVRGGS